MSDGTENSVTDIGVKGFDSYQVKLGDLMRGERATLGKSLLDVQRDLRIKAAYIAAIENCDPSVFQTPGFIAGHVRSYARYLELDPDLVFEMFCVESEFNGVHADPKQRRLLASFGESGLRKSAKKNIKKPVAANFNAFPEPLSTGRRNVNVNTDGLLSQLSGSSVMSIFVLVILICGIGYGALVVLEDFQRVEFAPINHDPAAIASLSTTTPSRVEGAAITPDALGRKAVGLDRLYRPQELDIPVLISRDGPISTLNPDRIGALVPGAGFVTEPEVTDTVASGPTVVEAPAPPISIVASRAAWVRVSMADGTILFEKILDAGESFELPSDSEPPVLRAGNAGFVFVTVGSETFGPIGDGTAVAKGVSLAQADIESLYSSVSDKDQLRAIENPKVITLNQIQIPNQ